MALRSISCTRHGKNRAPYRASSLRAAASLRRLPRLASGVGRVAAYRISAKRLGNVKRGSSIRRHPANISNIDTAPASRVAAQRVS
jgi:hypothetical protein